jgi:plastocyanin
MAMRIHRFAAAGTATLATVLTLAGCGPGGSSTSSSARSTPSSAASSGTSPSGTSPSGTSPAGTASVTVTETDFSIALSQTVFKPGAYTFTVVNQGQAPHNLAIEGPGIPRVVSQTVQGGASTRLSVPLQSGSYELWCTVDAHKERGMDKTIQVG